VTFMARFGVSPQFITGRSAAAGWLESERASPRFDLRAPASLLEVGRGLLPGRIADLM